MTPLPVTTAADWTPAAAPRWCPGCGNFAVLEQFKKALALAGVPRDHVALVAGVGCHGRLVHYLDAYGFQTLPGRAFAAAAGLTLANPDLHVWAVTGDADAVHTAGLLHLVRRNVNVKVLLLNNAVGGLAHGAASPGTKPGTRTRTTPAGNPDPAVRPLVLALAADATFVARSADIDVPHLTEVLRRAAAHVGSAVVEVYQNCRVFADDAWATATDRTLKGDGAVTAVHDRPLVFGPHREFGLWLDGLTPVVADLGPGGMAEADLLLHDEAAEDSTLALLLAKMTGPGLPEAFGVLRAVRRPTFGERVDKLAADAGPGGTLAAVWAEAE